MASTGFFPLFLDLTGKLCLVVGCGYESEEKAERLHDAGGVVRVVAPNLTPAMAELVDGGKATWIEGRFAPEHLEGVWFVLSTLTDPADNGFIERETEKRCIFLNVVDQPDFCSSIVPAVVDRHPVMAAFTTSGTAPSLAGRLKRELEENLHPDLGAFAVWLKGERARAAPKLENLAAKGRFWKTLLDGGLEAVFHAEGPDAARDRVDALLGEWS